MNLNQIKNYTKGVLQGWFLNKPALDKISESDDGKILYNNKELDVTEQVASIKKYQKYLNTELDYCACTHYSATVSYSGTGSIIPIFFTPTIYNTNMEYNKDENYVLLKAGKTYKIAVTARFVYSTSTTIIGYNIINKDTNKSICPQGIHSLNSNDSGTECFTIYTPTEDSKIMGALTYLNGTVTAIHSFVMTAQEINRQITIDPAEYINESQGLEDTPVGHIMSHMGTVAPKHYLICDGSEYNISDYPYLAQHIIDNFGSVNYFGGDGATTFAVPDLRGEFLRGTGTATRDTGSGSDVGIHQDPTRIPYIQGGYFSNTQVFMGMSGNNSFTVGYDKRYDNTNYYTMLSTLRQQGKSAAYYDAGSVRPTNTSVLYCIKYEPTYFMQVNNPLVGKGETVLWEGNLNINGETVTLNDNINNYNEFQIQIRWNNGGAYANLPIYTINDIKDSQEADCSIFATLYGICYVEFKMHENVFEVIAVSSTIPLAFSKIMGIKYAKLPEDTVLTQEQIQAAIDEDVF